MKGDVCEVKNLYKKQCQSLESEVEVNQKPEHPSRRATPQTQGGRKFVVYALTESGKIRYIGLTSQTLPKRLCQHLHDMRRANRKEHKTNWLRGCKRDGLTVAIKALRTGLSLEAAQRIEMQIIKRLRPQLVNTHEGGSSGYGGLTEDAKKRHRESGKARFLDPKHRARSKEIAKLMHSAKARKRMESPPSTEPRRVPAGQYLGTLRWYAADGTVRAWVVTQGDRANNIGIVARVSQATANQIFCGWDRFLSKLRKHLSIQKRIFT